MQIRKAKKLDGLKKAIKLILTKVHEKFKDMRYICIKRRRLNTF